MSNKKETNPKDAVGIAKVPMSTLSGPVLMEVGLAMMEGALKYGRSNYRKVGVRASVYFDALMRHAWSYWEGEDIDPDSGVHHVTKAIATLMVLRDCMIRGQYTDDRPPKMDPTWIKDMNAKAKALLLKYPNPVEAVTQLMIEKEALQDELLKKVEDDGLHVVAGVAHEGHPDTCKVCNPDTSTTRDPMYAKSGVLDIIK